MRSLMTALLVANTVMSAAAQAPVRVVRYGDDRLVGAAVGLDEAADALAALGEPGAARAGMTVVVP